MDQWVWKERQAGHGDGPIGELSATMLLVQPVMTLPSQTSVNPHDRLKVRSHNWNPFAMWLPDEYPTTSGSRRPWGYTQSDRQSASFEIKGGRAAIRPTPRSR
jgi:hypothetical protein